MIGTLVRSAANEFIRHHDDLLAGTHKTPLTEIIPQKDILEKIRKRSASGIYNHPSIAEIIGAGFELVMGMLDIFVPCVSDIAHAALNNTQPSCRSRRIAGMLPEHLCGETSYNAYDRLQGILDYISGMTDGNAVALYQKLKGISL